MSISHFVDEMTRDRYSLAGGLSTSNCEFIPLLVILNELSLNLERWEDVVVRLLITTYADNKHLFGRTVTKKDVF